MSFKVINGDNLVVLKTMEDNSVDSIVTDPPYGISFLSKGWDEHTGLVETYKECLRVLKPGGHILAFSAARTYHKLATSIEEAGFEIRDQIMWIYSSGFPKSQDVGKNIQRSTGIVSEAQQWEGWGTALKPGHEPIVMARKPAKQSIAKNVQEHGTGALHIDACRIPGEDLKYPANGMARLTFNQATPEKWEGDETVNDKGRFPSNVIGDIPEYQKFFYCPKVNRNERHTGFVDTTSIGNNHPTVKPVTLMSYLCKLITPPGGTVLDPFNGSGSTGMAAVENGFDYIGIELDPAYVEISIKRIESWTAKEAKATKVKTKVTTKFNELFE